MAITFRWVSGIHPHLTRLFVRSAPFLDFFYIVNMLLVCSLAVLACILSLVAF